MNTSLAAVNAQVWEKLGEARNQFPPLHSRHEGIAVIREEYLELEEAIFRGSDWNRVREEACQLAAMAIRLILDEEERAIG